jgi:murein L,D-transpeptidase YcbB/YkuD
MRETVRVGLMAGLLGLVGGFIGDRPGEAAVDDVYALRGAGQLSCAQYLEAYEEEGRVLYMTAGWVDGYVTALNRLQNGVFEHLSWQETGLVLDLLRNHCTANPEDVLANAVHLFVEATSSTRLTRSSELTEIAVPGGSGIIDIYRETIRRVQSTLAELGHYTATVDGAYGPGTAAAIRAFQAQHGLPENGLPDQRTLLVLFAPTFQGVN